MMKLKTLFSMLSIVIVSVVLLSISSCDKEDPCDYPNQSSADIVGNVNLFDDFQNPMDKSGMVVSIVGSIPLISDTTNEDGFYQLKDIPFGSYSLKYSKEGYGDFLSGADHNDECALRTEMPLFYLGKRSTTTITSLTAEMAGVNVQLNIEFFPFGSEDEPRYYRIFLSNQSDVSNASYDYDSGLLSTTSNSETVSLHVTDVHQMGFVTGETVYVKVYGDSYYGNIYYDVDLERHVHPNNNIVSPPNIEFIVL